MRIAQRSWLGITLLYMAYVTYLSTLPGDTVSKWGLQELLTNLMHVPMYSALAFFVLKTLGKFSVSTGIIAFMVSVSYGILNEYLQAQIPSRTFSIGDMFLNTLGATLMILCFFYITKTCIDT
ncbi:MAG: VanZ family protein [Candidatus Omnitrophica bacterium]|nr:VanZ family protein [Candidatus Omnitrophota bacterium]